MTIRLLAIVLCTWLAVLVASPAEAAFAFVKSANSNDNTSDTEHTVQLDTVTAGNLIVLWVKYEGDTDNDSTVSASDGTSSFVAGTVNDVNNDLHGVFLYLLVSVASGTVTYTVTFSEAVPWKSLQAREYSYTGTARFDATDVTGNGHVTAATSGPITTSSCTDGVVVGGLGVYSARNPTSHAIGGSAAGNEQTSALNSYSVDRFLTAVMSGGAFTSTLDAEEWYVANIIAFTTDAVGSCSSGGVGRRRMMGFGN